MINDIKMVSFYLTSNGFLVKQFIEHLAPKQQLSSFNHFIEHLNLYADSFSQTAILGLKQKLPVPFGSKGICLQNNERGRREEVKNAPQIDPWRLMN